MIPFCGGGEDAPTTGFLLLFPLPEILAPGSHMAGFPHLLESLLRGDFLSEALPGQLFKIQVPFSIFTSLRPCLFSHVAPSSFFSPLSLVYYLSLPPK